MGDGEKAPLIHQSIYSRLAGYDDTNPPPADRTSFPRPSQESCRGLARLRPQRRQHHHHSRFETETLTQADNLKGLALMNPQWVKLAMAHTPHRRVILDMDSSESPVHGQQEGAANNWTPPEVLQSLRRLRDFRFCLG